MFDMSGYAPDDPPRGGAWSAPEVQKEDCLETAALWVLRRRAHLPYLAPQRLPVAARGA
jgi:hypothetical protein